MGEVVKQLREVLWRGVNPFAAFPQRLYELDHQGWNSQHDFLSGTINVIRPRIVVEVGVWKGGSTLFMANRLRELGLDAVVIAVDTWLGSWDHWTDPNLFHELAFNHGYPSLYYKFASNIVAAGLQDYVVPLPLDSANARQVLARAGIIADMLHLDAAHDYAAVHADMVLWWDMVRHGGLFIGDDYYTEGPGWPEVKLAIDTFLASHPHVGFEAHGNKCRVVRLAS